MRYAHLYISALLVLTAILLGGCDKARQVLPSIKYETINGHRYKVYTIEKGNQYANGTRFKRDKVVGNCIKDEWIFGDECWYTEDLVEHSGYNKLTGLGNLIYIGNGGHNRSARIVWRPDHDVPGKIDLYAYIYSADTITHSADWEVKPMGVSVQTGEPFTLWISPKHDEYWHFEINGKALDFYGILPTATYRMLPFFGGQDFAYHKIKLYQRSLK